MADDPEQSGLRPFPIELIEKVHAELCTPQALVVARSVCREWYSINREKQWQRLFCSRCPVPLAWAQFGHTNSSGLTWRELYSRLHSSHRLLQQRWSASFRESFRFGKYSKWVCLLESPQFVPWLAMAVRLLGLTMPAAYLEVDGAPMRAYDPVHSFGGGGGGGLEDVPLDFDFSQFMLSEHAFLSLVMFELAPALGGTPAQRAQHEERIALVADRLCSSWGGKARTTLLKAAFDADRFLSMLEFLLEDLHDKRGRLNALFWDVRSITIRGIENCTGSNFNLDMDGSVDSNLNLQQLPPLFNLAKLCEHTEALHAAGEVPICLGHAPSGPSPEISAEIKAVQPAEGEGGEEAAALAGCVVL